MEFIDHTGHIFNIQSYSSYPFGYEYETNDYIFWLDGEYTNKLSINNYYVLPIRPVSNRDVLDVEIIVDSDVYSLLSSKVMHDRYKSYNKYVELEESLFTKRLGTEDITRIEGVSDEGDNEYIIFPFYVFGYSREEGTWLTNVLVKFIFEDGSEEYCPITVGGEYYDESEELIINGTNMGVRLPKDILKAVYQYSFYNEMPDESLYTEKLKEYMMNYMVLHGERGNYNSAISSLKWFGWGKKLTMTKLLQNDNEYLNQYVHDWFDVNTDILDSYKYFRNSQYIALRLEGNYSDGESEQYNFSQDFFGEAKPIMKDSFTRTEIRHYDEADIDFIRPYYDFIFDEMLLKLSCLKYFYETYFLPIHLKIHSASINHTVYANDKKMLCAAHSNLVEKSVMIRMPEDEVTFDGSSDYYIYNQTLYTDENFNIFDIYTKEYVHDSKSRFLYINEPCVKIPIKFNSINGNTTFNCVLLLLKNGVRVFESHFAFSNEKMDYMYFVFLPKILNFDLDYNFWENSEYEIEILCNNAWYEHSFKLKRPQMLLNIGSLQYNYYDYLDDEVVSHHTQIREITDDKVDFNSFMYVPDLVNVNDINFFDKVHNKSNLANISKVEFEKSYGTYLHYKTGFSTLTDTGYTPSYISLSAVGGKLTMGLDLPYIDSGTDKFGTPIDVLNTNKLKEYDPYGYLDHNRLPDVYVDGKKVPVLSAFNTVIFDGNDSTFDDSNKNDYVGVTIRLVQYLDPMKSINGSLTIDSTYTLYIKPNLDGFIGYCDIECGCVNCLHKQPIKIDGVVMLDMNEQWGNDLGVGPDNWKDIYDAIYDKNVLDQISALASSYTQKIDIPYYEKYFNKYCVYDILDSYGNKLVYDPSIYGDVSNITEDKHPAEMVALYREFFTDKGTSRLPHITDDYWFKYDFYLMHDDRYWYGVFISKETIANITTEEGMFVKKEFEYNSGANEYKFKLISSEDRFLINRMKFISSGGVNHFKKDDIIVAALDNVDFPSAVTLGTRWKIQQMSIDRYESEPVYSMTNACILSLEPENKKYKTGYFNIDVRYSLDGYTQQQQKDNVRILIEKD